MTTKFYTWKQADLWGTEHVWHAVVRTDASGKVLESSCSWECDPRQCVDCSQDISE